MNKTRLEAFSDGVMAIIITIMVLELKAPHGTDWASIKPLLPVLLSYVMSFLFVGVYWGNHHHLLHVAKEFTSGIMLANLNLLFWLSLVPFATGWMGETHFDTTSVAVYAVLLNICGLSYALLQKIIQSCHTNNSELQMLLKHQNKKVITSVALYGSAVPLAWLHPYISVAIFFVVAIMWLVPDKNIERAFRKKD